VAEPVSIVVAALLGAAVATVVAAVGFRRRVARVEQRFDRSTELHEAVERRATERSDLQASILDAMEEGVLLVRAEGRPLFSNVATARHLGTVPANAASIRPLELARCVQTSLETREVQRVEVETGSPARWLRATALPVDGDAVLLVIRDVTQARRLSQMRTDFVANASHELKTPVASIRAAAETLRDGAIDDPPAAHRFTEQLEHEAIRLSHIVADLLDLSRLESGSDGDERVRLDAIALDEARRFEGTAAERSVAITVDVQPVPTVDGSARDLSLMVGNLIDNAIRYTPPNGEVHVALAPDDGVVVLRVSDTGVGIPQRDLPRIFERFYRVDQARSRDTGGTGLGLAIVKHVCENHGGDVTVDSELGRGTTFEVRLPVATGRAAAAPA
jgi:two-component system phosphate regulon sensor histidine kinase PhoR